MQVEGEGLALYEDPCVGLCALVEPGAFDRVWAKGKGLWTDRPPGRGMRWLGGKSAIIGAKEAKRCRQNIRKAVLGGERERNKSGRSERRADAEADDGNDGDGAEVRARHGESTQESGLRTEDVSTEIERGEVVLLPRSGRGPRGQRPEPHEPQEPSQVQSRGPVWRQTSGGKEAGTGSEQLERGRRPTWSVSRVADERRTEKLEPGPARQGRGQVGTEGQK